MRILHISDLHFSSLYKKHNIIKTKKILQHASAEGFDHLVITGDISDNAEEKDFLLLKNMLKRFNLFSSDKTSIVIGNHDIFGGVQTAKDVMEFPNRCSNTNYEERVEKFYHFFKVLFEGVFRPDENKIFPFAKSVGNFLLIGLNTNDVYSKIKNPFASNGKVYSEQYENLSSILRNEKFSGKKKIILSHHHFYKNHIEATSSNNVWNRIETYTLKLRGKKKLLKLFAETDVKLVLHGHSHEIKEYYRKEIKFLNAGGSVDNNTKNEAFYFIINTESEKLSIRLQKATEREIMKPIRMLEEVLIPSAML